MDALLQILDRPEVGSPTGPSQSGGSALGATPPVGDSPFAAELRASADRAAAAAPQAENAPGKGPRSGGTGAPKTAADGSPGDPLPAGLAPFLVPAAGQTPPIAHGVPDSLASAFATPAAAGVIAATPAVPATPSASGGPSQPATPASPAVPAAASTATPGKLGIANAAPGTPPPDGQLPPDGTQAALHATNGHERTGLGEALSQIAATTKGSPELPSLLHGAMEAVERPQVAPPVVTPVQPAAAQGASAAATDAGTAVAPSVGSQAATAGSALTDGQADRQSGGSNQARPGPDAAAMQMTTAATDAELAAPHGGPAAGHFAPSASGQTAHAAGDGGPALASRAAIMHQPALDQVAMAVLKAHGGDREQISLRLHPAELGRIEVRLDTGDDGVLRANIIAEKAETLHLLQRDSGALERALHNAGVKTDSGSLAFDLKDSQREGRPTPDANGALLPGDPAVQPDEAALASAVVWQARHHGLLDLSV